MINGKFRVAGMLFEGKDIVEAKLDNRIVWQANPFHVDYELYSTSDIDLNYRYQDKYYICLPEFKMPGSDEWSIDFEDVVISLKEGGTTNDITTPVNRIKRVKVYYPQQACQIRFRGCMAVKHKVVKVNHIGIENFTSFDHMFEYTTLSYLNTSRWETQKITNMDSMFYSNADLVTIKSIDKWDVSNVKNMKYMFYNCGFEYIDIANWNTGNVIDMSHMFDSCYQLRRIELSRWNTENVETMQSMFRYCERLNILDVVNWNVAKVKTMEDMFYRCLKLITINIDKWETHSLENTKSMFADCILLDHVGTVSNLEFGNVTTMEDMFYRCKSLRELDGTNKWNTSKVTNMSRLFKNCETIKEIDLSNWGNSELEDASYMFEGCTSLKDAKLTNFNFGNIITLSSMFRDCISLESMDLSNSDMEKVENTNRMFYNCSSLKSVDMNGTKLSNVMTMVGMFYNCTSLKFLELSDINMHRSNGQSVTVTDMLYKVPANVNWNYDFTNYIYWVPTESETRFSGVFPWTGREEFFISYSLVSPMKLLPIDIPTMGNHTNFFKVDATLYNGETIRYMDITKAGLIETLSSQEVKDIKAWYPMNTTNISLNSISVEYLTGLNTERFTSLCSAFNDCTSLKAVYNLSVGPNIDDASYMFYNCNSLMSFNKLINLNNVTDSSYMFYNCTSLERVNITLEKVENASYMFYNCTSLCGVNKLEYNDATYQYSLISSNALKDTSYMFYNCASLISMDMDGQYYNNTSHMFENCTSLRDFTPESSLSFVKDARSMFKNCSSLEFLYAQNLMFTNVEYLDNMFEGCISLIDLGFEQCDARPISVNSMFRDCIGLVALRLGRFSGIRLEDASYMFYNCKNLTEYILYPNPIALNILIGSATKYTRYMFFNCNSLTRMGETTNCNLSNVEDMSHMFYCCRSLGSLDLDGWNVSNATNMESMFEACSAMKTINLSNWDVSNVKNFRRMFSGCTKLEKILSDSSSYTLQVTDKATDISYMFYDCSSLGEFVFIDTASWDVSNVTNMEALFYHSTFTGTNLSNWNTKNVKDMNHLFAKSNVNNAKVAQLSGWNTENVTDMSGMFRETDMTEISLPNWNTSNVTNMSSMFYKCWSLRSLDLSNWNTSNVVQCANMLDVSYNGNTLYAIDFNYTGSNYQNWTISSTSANYAYKFPWE